MKAEPNLCDYDIDITGLNVSQLGLYICTVCGKYKSRAAAEGDGWRCCGKLVEPMLHEQEDYDA